MSDEMHAWFRRRLPAHAAGLLNETEEREFLEHRAHCDACRQAFDEFTISDEAALTERGAHIPAAMLARWPMARRELAGLERAMVREHLRHCDECRGDLERAGHAPELDHVAALERRPRPLDWRARLFGKPPRTGAAHDAEGADARRRPAAARPSRRWVPWAVGGWATAATAAAIMLAVVPREPRVDTEMSREPRPPSEWVAPAPPPAPASPTPRQSYSLVPVPPTVRLRTPLRGTSDPVTSILVSEDTHTIQLAVGPLDLPEGTRLEAEVLAGDEIILHRGLAGAAAGGVNLLFGRAETPLAAGDYRLRLMGWSSATPPSRPDTVEFEFRIVRRGG